MKFCSECGSNGLLLRVPEGDTHERTVCGECGTIHYQNPRVVVGTIPVWGDKILLCKRAIEPRYGLWTLPAGFKTSCSQKHSNWRLGARLGTHPRRIIRLRFKAGCTEVPMAIREFE